MAPKRSAAAAGLAAPSASSKGPKRAKTTTTGSVAAVAAASSSSAQTSVPSSQAAPSTRSAPQRFSAVDDMRIIYLKEFLHWGGSQLDAAMQAHGRTWRQVQPQYSRALRRDSSDAKIRARRARAFASGYNPSTDPAVLASGDAIVPYLPAPSSTTAASSSSAAAAAAQGLRSLVVKLRVRVAGSSSSTTTTTTTTTTTAAAAAAAASSSSSSSAPPAPLAGPTPPAHTTRPHPTPLPRTVQLPGYEPVTVPPLPLARTGLDNAWPVSDVRFTRVEGEVVRVRFSAEEMPVVPLPRAPAGPRGLTKREIEEDFEEWRRLGLL